MSRATLLSGVHQGHTQVRDNQFDKALADNHTIASVLKEAGYRTWMVGKHGLQERREPCELGRVSTQRGFDRFLRVREAWRWSRSLPAEVWPLGNSEAHRSRKEVWHNNMEVSKDLSKMLHHRSLHCSWKAMDDRSCAVEGYISLLSLLGL